MARTKKTTKQTTKQRVYGMEDPYAGLVLLESLDDVAEYMDGDTATIRVFELIETRTARRPEQPALILE